MKQESRRCNSCWIYCMTPWTAVGTTGCFVRPDCAILQHFLGGGGGGESWKSRERSGAYGVQHLPTHGERRVLYSARQLGTGVFMRQDGTPRFLLVGVRMAWRVAQWRCTLVVIWRFLIAEALKGRRFGWSDEDICATAGAVVPAAAQGVFWSVSWMPISVLIMGYFNSLFFIGLISATLVLKHNLYNCLVLFSSRIISF